YMKAVVMKYIKNLIDWGDALFSENTRESITQATNLYMMAHDLLGHKPEALGPKDQSAKASSFNDFLRGKVNYSTITESILINLEDHIKSYVSKDSKLTFNEFNPYFNVPENKEFIGYWERIADRLFKIRHCLNMQGIRQELDLFSPEIDPHQLVRA